MKRLILPTLAATLALSAAQAQDTHTNGVNISDSDGASADLFVSDASSLSGFVCIGFDCTDAYVFGGVATPPLVIQDQAPGFEIRATGQTTFDWSLNLNTVGTFLIRDVDTGTSAFVIGNSPPSNALVIEGTTGDIGLGTASPTAPLHLAPGGVPFIRFDEGSQLWDLYGNDSSFGLLDTTNAKNPFSIGDNSPDHSFRVQGFSGDIGLQTSSPDASLHVKRTDGTARILVEETNGTVAAREMFLMKNNGGSYFTLSNTNSGRDWFFVHENAAQGRFIITASTDPSKGTFISPNGNMQIGGALTQNSDKNAKMAIAPVDTAGILEKVAALPVAEWSYIDDEGTRHLGPMAQDFHALFGLGATETGISTLDTSGVALAAIQALAEQNETLVSENTALKQGFERQQALIDRMLARLAALEGAN